LPVVLDCMRVAEHPTKQLDRLGLAREAKPLDLIGEVKRLHAQNAARAFDGRCLHQCGSHAPTQPAQAWWQPWSHWR
jgi:hypothetical protein